MRYGTLKILDYRVGGNHTAGTKIANLTVQCPKYSWFMFHCVLYTARFGTNAGKASHSQRYIRSNSMFRQICIIDYEWTEVGVRGLEREIWQLALTMNRRHAH